MLSAGSVWHRWRRSSGRRDTQFELWIRERRTAFPYFLLTFAEDTYIIKNILRGEGHRYDRAHYQPAQSAAGTGPQAGYGGAPAEGRGVFVRQPQAGGRGAAARRVCAVHHRRGRCGLPGGAAGECAAGDGAGGRDGIHFAHAHAPGDAGPVCPAGYGGACAPVAGPLCGAGRCAGPGQRGGGAADGGRLRLHRRAVAAGLRRSLWGKDTARRHGRGVPPAAVHGGAGGPAPSAGRRGAAAVRHGPAPRHGGRAAAGSAPLRAGHWQRRPGRQRGGAGAVPRDAAYPHVAPL